MLVSAVGGAAQTAGTPIATGLSSPFFVTVGDDGMVYVAEGGSGQGETINPPPGSPPDAQPITRGLTGSVIRIAPDGTKTTVASKLPSYDGAGPTGLVVANGFIWQVLTAPPPIPGLAPLSDEGWLVKISLRDGSVARVADIAGYEQKNNPDGVQVESNPWALALGPDGNLYATDAAGNDLLRINPTSGQISVAAVFPPLPGTEPNPARGNRNEVDPVPTSVAVAPDGGFYVSYLPGEAGAPPPNSGKVVRLAADGKIADVATGFSFTVGVAVGPDRLLYVVELTAGFGPPATPDGPPAVQPGRITRVLPNGTKQVVADGLMAPHGIAFDKAGNLYVTTNVVSFGPPGPPAGQVLRFAAVAPPAAPTPAPQPTPQPPMPGLPNTGAGGGQSPTALLVLFGVAAAFGAVLVARRRYARH